MKLLVFFVLVFFATAASALDKVPAKDTFRYANQGEYGEYADEYGSTYRPTPIATSPFNLMWYNTTPGHYFLALRMGTRYSDSVRRWVWEANRGRPVGENATLTFAADGNLVIADADGRVAWSTNTANKGVVGLRLLNTGNLVLYDKKNRFLWQSFDHPTDTLLVGQSLPVGGTTKLVSRRSPSDGSPGPYSLIMEETTPVLYVDSGSTPIPYFRYEPGYGYSDTKDRVTFDVFTSNDISYGLSLNGRLLTVTKYNSTFSFLRLQPDGDLVIQTFDDRVDYMAWDTTFTLFSEKNLLSACLKPGRCGRLGVCDDEMCVGCPTAKGMAGWGGGCATPKLGPCRTGASPKYFKVGGVESFVSKYSPPVNVTGVDHCRRLCSAACGCLGFLYWEEAAKCWPAALLGTLYKVAEPRHTVFVKAS